MATAKEIHGWYKDFLDRNGVRYNEDEEDNIIRIVMPIEGKLQKTNMMVQCSDTHISTRAFIPLNADGEVRLNMSEYLVRANYGLTYGNFEMDARDGEIAFKLTLDCEDRTSLSDDLLQKIFVIPQLMIEKYGDGLLAVMFGAKSPEDAINDAEGDAESDADDENGCCCGHDHGDED